MGWIKLYHQIQDSYVWRDPRLLQLWIWCLLRANHKPTKVLIGGESVDVPAGSFLTGRAAGAAALRMPQSTFWRLSHELKKLGNLDIISDSRKSLYVVQNWGLYQGAGQQLDSKWTTNGQPVDTDKKKNKTKDKRTVQDHAVSTASDFDRFWKAYPNRVGKVKAHEAFIKALGTVTADRMIEAIEAQIRDRELKARRKQFVPAWKHPATWLNQGCWDDEVSSAPTGIPGIPHYDPLNPKEYWEDG